MRSVCQTAWLFTVALVALGLALPLFLVEAACADRATRRGRR